MSFEVDRRTLLGGIAGLIGVGAAFSLAGCTVAKPEVVPSDDDVNAQVVVRVSDNVYEPSEVNIAPGQAVRWEFVGPGEHDVVAEDGSFVSELITNGTYTHVFESAGEFAYDCSIHPEMTGVVTVAE